MKNLSVFALAIICIVGVVLIGVNGLLANYAWGPFFLFIGTCSTVGLTIDIFNHFRTKGTR
jgi:hypothetical protein